MPTGPSDILHKLTRLLMGTPEHAFAVPAVPRGTILAAATEIALLHKRVEELEADGDDLVAIIAASTVKVEA